MEPLVKYEYEAVCSHQTSSQKAVVLFNAPADEILHWAGVPQKKRFDEGGESVGFQREESATRVQHLGAFCSNAENIIQNPLLCATRDTLIGTVTFKPAPDQTGPSKLGTLIITVPRYEEYTLQDVFSHVQGYIEQRVPDLVGKQISSDLLVRLKEKAGVPPSEHVEANNQDSKSEVGNHNSDTEDSSLEAEPDDSEAEGALFEESHIFDFWEDVSARATLLKQIDIDQSRESFLGYSRNALESYLKPVVLVDGQHRLQGAIHALDQRMNGKEIRSEIEEMIDSGKSPEDVNEELRKRETRSLPLSLLLSSDPAEQVFQFVVVNQKATPIGKALLGTIVSTTLSKRELDIVANRLQDAGIELEESKAITFLARHQNSPFYNLVERGLAGGESSDLLGWNVLASLVHIFRHLKGGRLFHGSVDYADRWKNKYLSRSGIVPDDKRDNCYDCWRDFDGIWRDVFIRFFTKIRDIFGNRSIADSHNYWGKPRVSNLFNKISLTILSADFFRYLCGAKRGIDSLEHVDELIDDWLEDVDPSYFNRDWKLSGVKKDSTGIRSQWSQLWANYRDSPARLPRYEMYRRPSS